MSDISTVNRFSLYSIWFDINRALLDDIESNKSIHSSYVSPITVSCIEWMGKVGDAFRKNDSKKAYHYLCV